MYIFVSINISNQMSSKVKLLYINLSRKLNTLLLLFSGGSVYKKELFAFLHRVFRNGYLDQCLLHKIAKLNTEKLHSFCCLKSRSVLRLTTSVLHVLNCIIQQQPLQGMDKLGVIYDSLSDEIKTMQLEVLIMDGIKIQ